VGEQLKQLEQQVQNNILSVNNQKQGEDRQFEKSNQFENQNHREEISPTDVPRTLDEGGPIDKQMPDTGSQEIFADPSDEEIKSKIGEISLHPPYKKEDAPTFSDKQLYDADLREDRNDSGSEDLAPGRC
jgi:hypothetical protein